MLENYAKCTCLLQSPRSGKFVSDIILKFSLSFYIPFQSPRSGKFVSDYASLLNNPVVVKQLFQSPRSGKFISNRTK